MSDASPAVGAFLDAARYAGDVLESPAVAAAWTRDSALPRMTVGAVAGHLYLVVRRVDQHLDEPEPIAADPAVIAPYQWMRVERPEDLDREDHRVVRADGDHVAKRGWDSVETSYTARVDKVAARLAAHCPRNVALATGVMDFASYLATRVVELLVHADDLAVSVGLTPSAPPADAATVAIELLVDAARSIYGDLDVLRSLTRAERVRPPAPGVY
jgi:hypothetical protein